MATQETKSDDQILAEKADGIPRWVKTTGAVIGVVATVATIFTGIYSLVIEIQKQKTAQAVEESNAEKERTVQLRLEAQEKERARKERQAEFNKQLAIEAEKSQQARVARETAQLELENQVRQEKREDLNRQRDQLLQDRRLLLEAVSKLEDPENPHLGTLLTISRYAAGDVENQDLVIRALAAHAEKTCSASEVRVVFGTYHEIGMASFQRVIELNQLAFQRFSRSLRSYLFDQLRSAVALSDNEPVSAANEPLSRRVECKVIERIASEYDTLNFEFQVALLAQHWRENPSKTAAAARGENREGVVVKDVRWDLACAAVTLAESGRSIEEFIHRFPDQKEVLDLPETYIAEDPLFAWRNGSLEASYSFYKNMCGLR